ncbi:ribosome maturation factor RimP [Spirosoma sp. KNUC1025]|uniref:ribosome maturation factor RimP n=1 Tax=Spirosoma sp. KNUC1025 TaxID=2894082 RepID=UPI00386A6FF2|nr:ribosome maturation factor RimP [Spirosoma sp. KNUC1025]
MDDKEKIAGLLGPYLNDGHFYVVDIQVAGRRGGHIKVTILLDSDAGITIDECADISRKLGTQMDELNFFGEAPFTLEVSSPGVDYPLTAPRQFVRNVGRQLVVTLADGNTRKGTLESVTSDHIVLVIEPEKKPKSKKKKEADLITEAAPVGPTPILFSQIKKANVEVSFK